MLMIHRTSTLLDSQYLCCWSRGPTWLLSRLCLRTGVPVCEAAAAAAWWWGWRGPIWRYFLYSGLAALNSRLPAQQSCSLDSCQDTILIFGTYNIGNNCNVCLKMINIFTSTPTIYVFVDTNIKNMLIMCIDITYLDPQQVENSQSHETFPIPVT